MTVFKNLLKLQREKIGDISLILLSISIIATSMSIFLTFAISNGEAVSLKNISETFAPISNKNLAVFMWFLCSERVNSV